jgi:hypothetical protein
VTNDITGFFEHSKLTPTEHRDLLGLETVLPRHKFLDGLDSYDEGTTTSWSAIFLLARREIVDARTLLEELTE